MMQWNEQMEHRTRSVLRMAVSVGLCAVFASAADAAPGDGTHRPAWWQTATQAEGYHEVTAWDPQFDNASLWPELTGEEAFVQQQWSDGGRLYIWAHPGETGNLHLGRRRSDRDPTKPENWIDGATGEPATELVLDEKTDLLLPASDERYTVGFRTTGVRETLRHVTIESGAQFIGGGDGAGRTIYGNVWVKQGGRIYAQGATTFVGNDHTFFRNDNVDGQGSQYFRFNKAEPDISVEFLGHTTTSDEWWLDQGMVIVGPDSVMQPGRAASPTIREAGTLVLLDGAYWGKWCNEWHGPIDLTIEGGTVLAGLPNRPLRRDATLALSVRNWAGLDFEPWSNGKDYSQQRVSGLFHAGSTIRTLAAEDSDAALVITRYELGGPYAGRNGRSYLHHIGEYGTYEGQSEKDRGLFSDEAFLERFDSRPHKALLYLDENVTIDGPVRLDHFPAGGILCADPTDRGRAWTDLSFGPNNLAEPEALFEQREQMDDNGAL